MTGMPSIQGYGSYFLICEIISATICLLLSKEVAPAYPPRVEAPPRPPIPVIPTPASIFIRDTEPRIPTLPPIPQSNGLPRVADVDDNGVLGSKSDCCCSKSSKEEENSIE